MDYKKEIILSFDGLIFLPCIMAKNPGTYLQDHIAVLGTLHMLGALGGNSHKEVSATVKSLWRGFARGILKADELNSITENTPAITGAIAQGMGISMGQLRAGALHGRLTSKKVFNAILAEYEHTNDDFERMSNNMRRVSIEVASLLAMKKNQEDESLSYQKEIIKRLEGLVPDPQDGYELYVSDSSASGSHFCTDVDVTFKLDQRPVKDGVSIEYVSTEDLIDSWKATINDFRVRHDNAPAGGQEQSELERAIERYRAKIRKSKRDLSRAIPREIHGKCTPHMKCTVPPHYKSQKEPEKMSTKKEEVTIKNLPAAPEGWEYTGEFGIAGKGEYIARWRMVNAAGEAAGLEITRPPSGDSTGFIVRKKIKEIDMQAVIDCGLDLEFSTLQRGAPWLLLDRRGLSYVGTKCYRFSGLNLNYDACRIRQGHRFAFDGVKNPLPDWFIVKVFGPAYVGEGLAQDVDWHLVYWFEVIGVASGYKYPWQS